jgi:hypothetical protein
MVDRAVSRQSEAVAAVDVGHGGRWPKETIVSLAAFFVLWHLASMVLPPFVAPSWARIGRSLVDIATRPEFIAITVARVAVALLVSFALGMALAMAMYRWNVVERYLMPLVKLLMAVPVLCWILFAVLWFRRAKCGSLSSWSSCARPSSSSTCWTACTALAKICAIWCARSGPAPGSFSPSSSCRPPCRPSSPVGR